MPVNPQLTVIVPARKDRAHVERLLSALTRGFAAHALAGEIIVVANGGDDGTAAVCSQLGAICLAHDESLTPAAARNAGAATARGAWLAFLDADVEPLDSWFAAVKRLAESGDVNGAAGWEVIVPPGAGWLPIAWEHVRMAAARTQRYINTGNLVMARPLFDKAGGFDAARLAGEDAEFGDRILAAGGVQTFDAQLACLHHGEPRGVRDFFRRQLFHSEPLGVVLRAARAPLNLAIVAIIGATITGIAGAPWVWSERSTWGVIALLLGPAVLVAMATAKAAAGWRSTIALPQFPRMVAACTVMLTARAVGTVWQLRSWRT